MTEAEVSDDAIRLYLGFFLNPKSTLSFGGDHAESEMTTRARDALNELLEVGAVKPAKPDDQWPNREHYTGGDTDLRGQLQNRPHLNPFKDTDNMKVFQRKQSPTGEPRGDG